RRSSSHRSSSAASSARRWPTSPASPGARAASARCSPSSWARSPPCTPRKPPAPAGRETPAPAGVAATCTGTRSPSVRRDAIAAEWAVPRRRWPAQTTGEGIRVPERSDRNAKIIEEFRTNGGKVGGPFEGAPLLLLHTVGAKTGQQRVNPMMYRPVPGGYAVFASKGGAPTNPDWYHNLLAHPDVEAEIGTQTLRP